MALQDSGRLAAVALAPVKQSPDDTGVFVGQCDDRYVLPVECPGKGGQSRIKRPLMNPSTYC